MDSTGLDTGNPDDLLDVLKAVPDDLLQLLSFGVCQRLVGLGPWCEGDEAVVAHRLPDLLAEVRCEGGQEPDLGVHHFP